MLRIALFALFLGFAAPATTAFAQATPLALFGSIDWCGTFGLGCPTSEPTSSDAGGGSVTSVPELDGDSTGMGLALLVGGALVLAGRRRRDTRA